MKKLIQINGMHCMHCAGTVKKALEALGGEADVSLEEKYVLLTSENEIQDADIKAAIEKKGFTVTGIQVK